MIRQREITRALRAFSVFGIGVGIGATIGLAVVRLFSQATLADQPAVVSVDRSDERIRVVLDSRIDHKPMRVEARR